MTKPRNMTPEDEREWREREKARRATPEYKAKAERRARRWYEKNKDKVIASNAAARATDEGRERRNASERRLLRESAEKKAREKARQAAWRSTPEGREKSRAKTARYAQRKRLNEQYEFYIDRVQSEPAESGL